MDEQVLAACLGEQVDRDLEEAPQGVLPVQKGLGVAGAAEEELVGSGEPGTPTWSSGLG